MAKRQRRLLRIAECWLYAINSKRDLARRLSTPAVPVSIEALEKLAKDAGNFRLFCAKSSGGRAIQEPVRELQKIHKRIHTLLSRIETPTYLHSARKGMSYLTNARSHNASAATIKIDVKKFFQSVPRTAIRKFFADSMKCRGDVASILADILTYEGHLPTGSSASPIVSYYAFKKMFDELRELAVSADLRMTCYVDDITFSGDAANRGTLFSAHKIIRKYGLKSHKMKTFSPSQPKIVTGICNTVSGERVPNKLHQKIGSGFRELRAASSDEDKLKVLRPLLGRLEAARQIEKAFGARAKTLRSEMKSLLNPPVHIKSTSRP